MKVFKIFLSVGLLIVLVTIFSVAQASEVTTKKSQRQVIHDFMKSLDKSNYVVNSQEDVTKILDEAVVASSNGKFTSYRNLVECFVRDCKATDDSITFLKNYCGIDLTTRDTGAIIGSDVSGNPRDTKSNTEIVPENTPLIDLTQFYDRNTKNFDFSSLNDKTLLFDKESDTLKFTKNGFTLIIEKYTHIIDQADKVNPENENSFVDGLNSWWLVTTNKEYAEAKDKISVINGLYSWWIEESLKLIEKSYEIRFDDSDSTVNEATLTFFDADNGIPASAPPDDKNFDGKSDVITLNINLHNAKNLDLKSNPDGKVLIDRSWYFYDSTIAHELTHAIMGAKINYFNDSTYHKWGFIAEGMAQLTKGGEDLLGDFEITVANKIKNPNVDGVDFILNPSSEKNIERDSKGNIINGLYYCRFGYALLRYFAKQVSDASIPVVPNISTNETEMLKKLVGTYKGSYANGNWYSGMTLNVFQDTDGTFKATWDFYNLPGQNNTKHGMTKCKVSYDVNSKSYTIQSYEWINQPEGYGFMSLTGQLNGDTLSGNSPARFSVTRVNEVPNISTNETEMLRKLVGIYKGSYVAGQDEVGTTLTIFEDIDGTFKAVWDFYNLSNKTNYKEGNTRCHVKYDAKTRMYSVQSYEWIDRKLNYPFLTLSGRLNGNIFSGDLPIKFSVTRINEVPDISTNETEMLKKLVGVYKGSYFATQGETGLTLTVYEENNQFKALFDFYNLPGRTNAKSGKYYMNVSYDKISGNYKLDAYQWLEQPSGYEFINLNGKLDKNILSGDSISLNGLRWRFNVTRVNDSNVISTVNKTIPSNALSYKGHHYYIYSNVCNTWEEAKKYCENLGGHLAVINDKAENDELYKYITSRGHKTAYFGLSDSTQEGNWKWLDDSVNYYNWFSGEPNGGRFENYAEFYYQFPDGRWNDGNFGHGTQNDSKTFICEWDY